MVELDGQQLVFRFDGTLLIPANRALLVADLHLGKDSSFRAAGFPVPQGMGSNALERLGRAIEATGCEHLIFLGDLIHNRHSVNDKLINQFESLRERHRSIKMTLVKGNHDRDLGSFANNLIEIVHDGIQLGPFWLTHDPNVKKDDRVIGGHIHPVVKVGKIDQMKCKCFAVDSKRIVLPAFGEFTGGHLVSARNLQRCFAIKEEFIFAMA